MNSDEFEQKLRQQPFRQIPSEWRGEILAAAGSKAGRGAEAAPTLKKSWWRELFWPCPQAWAGLAAAWLMIVVLNTAAHPSRSVVARSHPISATELIEARAEQARLMAELMSPGRSAAVSKPVRRREEDGPHSELILYEEIAQC